MADSRGPAAADHLLHESHRFSRNVMARVRPLFRDVDKANEVSDFQKQRIRHQIRPLHATIVIGSDLETIHGDAKDHTVQERDFPCQSGTDCNSGGSFCSVTSLTSGCNFKYSAIIALGSRLSQCAEEPSLGQMTRKGGWSLSDGRLRNESVSIFQSTVTRSDNSSNVQGFPERFEHTS